MCLTKTWLHRNTSQPITAALEALQKCCRVQPVRKNETGKGKAILSFFFCDNDRCYNPGCITVKAHICGREVEPLAEGFKTTPLSQAIALIVTILQSAHADAPCNVTHCVIAGLQLL